MNLNDCESIRKFTKLELREKMGLVLQDPFLFYGTVKDNIRLHNEALADEQVEEAARFVQAYPFIEKLEDGFNHKVVERGATLPSVNAIDRFRQDDCCKPENPRSG
jgi:ATP-binding cassette, subfamily B, multidrug efflux pump